MTLAHREDRNDVITVCGDVWNIRRKSVEQFRRTKYKNAMERLKIPWGKDRVSSDGSLIRRADVNDDILHISNDSVDEYLSEENIRKAVEYFYEFGGRPGTWSWNKNNHLYTWLNYVFFFPISSNRNTNHVGMDLGTVRINYRMLDND